MTKNPQDSDTTLFGDGDQSPNDKVAKLTAAVNADADNLNQARDGDPDHEEDDLLRDRRPTGKVVIGMFVDADGNCTPIGKHLQTLLPGVVEERTAPPNSAFDREHDPDRAADDNRFDSLAIPSPDSALGGGNRGGEL